MKELSIRKSKARRPAYQGWRGPIWLALILASAMAIYLSLASRIPDVAAGSSAASASPSSCWDDVKGHCYPRRGIFHWGGAPAEWYAKFDLISTRNDDINFAQQIKTIHPHTFIVPAFFDWNRGTEDGTMIENYYLHTAGGSRIQLYGLDECWYADLTDIGQPVGERYIDFVPQYLGDRLANSILDGALTDGIYRKTHYEYFGVWDDVDIDHNKVNDRIEYGDTWILNHHVNGVDILIPAVRSAIGDDKLLILNTGSSEWFGQSYINGYLFEHSGPHTGNWTGEYSMQELFANFEKNLRHPVVHLHNFNPSGADPKVPLLSKNYFSFMRFSLGRSMLLGTYMEFCDLESGEHYWNKYYDEFDLNIGYPTGAMQEVKSGVWARYFDYGAAIINVNGYPVTVGNQELQDMTGYYGPYYRFQGGQDPMMNNGRLFSSVQLDGHSWENDGLTWIVGDAIILVDAPTTAVSDIIIDNVDAATSPASLSAELIGSWQQSNSGSGYALSNAGYMGSYRYAYTDQNSDVAIFRPTIGVPGQYEVFEWHGDRTDATEATNVRHLLKDMTPVSVAANCSIVSGGADCIVNQRENQGQWNSLGIYTFNAGTQGHVTISAQGANGTVIADAIKFVYQGNHGNIKGEPVSPFEDINLDGRIDILDLQLAINVLLGVEKDSGIIARADVNRDGQVNRADVQQIGSRILSKR